MGLFPIVEQAGISPPPSVHGLTRTPGAASLFPRNFSCASAEPWFCEAHGWRQV